MAFRVDFNRIEMNSKVSYTIYLICLLMVTSCRDNGNNDISHTLDAVESLMDSNPDSAMRVLNAINSVDIKKDRVLAKYRLLKFAVLTKTGNLPDTDSLLFFPRRYYMENDRLLKEKMLTHFFTAYYFSFHNRDDDAIDEYREAIEIGNKLDENLYAALALTNMGAIYGTKWVGREELKYTRRGLKRIKLTDDTLRIANAYNEYGVALMHNGKLEAADKAFEVARAMYGSVNNYSKEAEVLCDAGFNASQMYDDEKTLRYYNLADSIAPGCFKATDHGIMAHALINLEKYDEAGKHIHRMKPTLEDAADTVLWCFTSWHLAKSTGYAADATYLVDSLINMSNAVVNNVLNTSPLYREKDRLETDLSVYKELAKRKTIIIILCILLVVMACGFLIYVIVVNRRNRKRERGLHAGRLHILQDRVKSYAEDIKKKEEALSLLQTAKESLERNLAEIKDKLQNLTAMLKHRDSLLEQAGNVISQYESIIADTTKSIDGKDRVIAFKDKLLEEKEAMLEAQKGLLEGQKSLFETEKEYLNSEIEKANREVADMENNLEEANESIDKLECLLIESKRGYYKMMSEVLESDDKKIDSKTRQSLDAQKKAISDKYKDKKSVAGLERYVNENMENILDLIDNDTSFGNIDDESRLILVYTLVGFGYRAISCLMEKNPKTVSAMKSSLIRKLVMSSSENREIYFRYLKGMIYSKKLNK